MGKKNKTSSCVHEKIVLQLVKLKQYVYSFQVSDSL